VFVIFSSKPFLLEASELGEILISVSFIVLLRFFPFASLTIIPGYTDIAFQAKPSNDIISYAFWPCSTSPAFRLWKASTNVYGWLY